MFAITAGAVFDGHKTLAHGTVLVVDGGRIAAAQSAESPLPEGCAILDFPHATVLPGLFDAHVHLCCDSGPGALERIGEATDDEMTAIIEASLRQQLEAGVTTVRDLGDRAFAAVDWRDHHATRIDLPTVLVSGPPITSTQGHCWNMGGEAAGADALRRAVDARAERGVDVVKIMASGGANTPGSDAATSQFTIREIELVVERAHSVGLQVTAHSHALSSIRDVVEAGVDGIEHCTFLTETRLDPDPEVITAIATAQIPVCPTLGFRPGAVMPPAIVELMRRKGMTPERRATIVASMLEAGVRIIAGADAGINPGKHHGVLPEALVHLADAGVAPAAVLASATSVAAAALGLADRKGRLEPGLDADILVVEGDAMADITALRNVAAVFLAGERVL